jgi:hypothetical protein
MDKENLSAAEGIIQTLIGYTDHMVHNRPGMVVRDPSARIGVRWTPVTHKVEGDDKKKVVYQVNKVGRKTTKVKVGTLADNGYQIKADNGNIIGEYRSAGIFPEVATWMYRQAADVYAKDNEFAAHWASYAFKQEHRDLKVILAALMLVQTRKGDPVLDTENGGKKVAFHDEDYRDIGEAMMLLHTKDGKDFNPKLLLRVYDVLMLPGVAAINRELGFGKSARRPFLGRWEKAVEKWLLFREENPKLLEGLVKAGFRQTVMDLARRVGYKPTTTKFFETLRWKQAQAKDGRRTLAIGQAVEAAETWVGLSEEQICERIVKDRPNYKRIVGMLPNGVTRAILTAAIEAGSLSNKDLVILTPTIEELGLMQVQDVRERWEKANAASEDMRAANIATRVKSKEVKEKLQEGADKALQKAVVEVMKGLVIYFILDISGSMVNSIPTAKKYIAQFLQAFPLDKLHVSVFNTAGRRIEIKHASAAGIENAFRGIAANGGTSYGEGVRALQDRKPGPGEDAIMIFVGDEQAPAFMPHVRNSGINPIAFGLLKVGGGEGDRAVRDTAAQLGIPCLPIDDRIFANLAQDGRVDPYAIPRAIRNLIAATPVGITNVAVAPQRVSLVDEIVNTKLLVKPAWAA